MKKYKLLYYSILKYQRPNYELLREKFDIVELESPAQDTNKILADIQIILAPLGFHVDKEKIDKCSNLKIIGSNTTGHPHIDVDYAKTKGISVITLKKEKEFLDTITPTAELAWGSLIALTRNIIPANQSVHEGKWNRRPFGGKNMLSRMKIGIVGLGRLGKRVAQYARAFNMDIYYYDPFVSSGHPGLIKCDTLEELVSKVDVVSVHVPHEKQTEEMFNQQIFSHFKQNSYFINTSRGELVNHDALLNYLRNGHISGAAIDVFENEFSPEFEQSFTTHELLQYARNNSNLLITPHIGGSTQDAWLETERHTIDAILNTLGGNNIVDYEDITGKGSVFALIPARGGSKSIPLKNMALLNSRPLIDYAIEAGKNTSIISRVICSTDNEKIANYCINNGVEVQPRPAKLSKDNITTIDVIIYFLEELKSQEKKLPQYLVLLEPTSPFVTPKHIQLCVNALNNDPDADSAQTVTRATSNSHAYNQRYHDENGSHFLFVDERKTCINKQLKPHFFIHGNVRVMRVSSLMQSKNLFGIKSIPIEISRISATDVDGPEDFLLAESILASDLLTENSEKK